MPESALYQHSYSLSLLPVRLFFALGEIAAPRETVLFCKSAAIMRQLFSMRQRASLRLLLSVRPAAVCETAPALCETTAS